MHNDALETMRRCNATSVQPHRCTQTLDDGPVGSTLRRTIRVYNSETQTSRARVPQRWHARDACGAGSHAR
eukprot:6895807-Lingulodinium_polyedra.AAC.1